MKNLYTILFCCGSRPELIKIAPVYYLLKQQAGFITQLCVTGQQKDLVSPLLETLDITPDFHLDVMRKGQSLEQLLRKLTEKLPEIITFSQPDLVIIQGDTSSAFAAAMVAKTHDIPVAHIEAGLRTYDITAPFPEEIYRQAITKVAQWHFCPTDTACRNLLEEDITPSTIFVTGNTAIDMVQKTARAITQVNREKLIPQRNPERPYFLVTLHRRESQGSPLRSMIRTLSHFAQTHSGFDMVLPLHPNPASRDMIQEHMAYHANIHLIEPVDYPAFVFLMMGAFAIITDSGGIQEEAPALNIPVIVTRTKTERYEGVEKGCLRLAGTDRDTILQELDLLIHDKTHYKRIQSAQNPFGDGHAAERIVRHLKDIAESNTPRR